MINDLIVNHAWFAYSLIALFSLAVGSLLNVVIYRLPLMIQSEWTHDCCELLNITESKERPNINLFFPRSFCPNCKALIRAWQNIPILSYLYLQGRCNECQHPISVRYPLIEFITLIVSLYACWQFGLTLALPFVLIASWLLICMIFIDYDHQLLPDGLTLGLLWLGLLANTHHVFTSLLDAVYSAVGAYLFLWLLIKIFYLITGKIGMGNGDFKLFAAFGALFGWVFLPLILLISSITGALVGIFYLRIANKSKDTPIPFGPFLCLGGLICLFWGNSIINWYLNYWAI